MGIIVSSLDQQDEERAKPEGDEEEHADGDDDEKDENASDSSMAVDIGRFFRCFTYPRMGISPLHAI